jgi:hypothetical protein
MLYNQKSWLLKGSDNKLKINRTIKQIDRMEKGLYINNLRQVGRYFMQNITSVKDENVPLSKVFQMPSSSFYISS